MGQGQYPEAVELDPHEAPLGFSTHFPYSRRNDHHSIAWPNGRLQADFCPIPLAAGVFGLVVFILMVWGLIDYRVFVVIVHLPEYSYW